VVCRLCDDKQLRSRPACLCLRGMAHVAHRWQQALLLSWQAAVRVWCVGMPLVTPRHIRDLLRAGHSFQDLVMQYVTLLQQGVLCLSCSAPVRLLTRL
jgi:hypothetical protein